MRCPDPSQSIGDAFLAAAAARPAKDAWLTLILGDGREQSFSTAVVLDEVLVWRNWIAARISAPGERVTICLEPSLALYASFLGAIMAGAAPSIFAPPSPKQKKQDSLRVFRTLLEASGSRLLITTVADFADLAGDRMVVAPDRIDRAQPPGPSQPPDTHSVAFVQYSSGTTGLKKGVAVTHAALVQHVGEYARSIGLSAADRIVSWLPLYHDMGLITALFMPLLTGAPLIAMSPLDWVSNPAMLLAAIERHGATLCWQPNFAYNFLAKYRGGARRDLSSIRLWVNCSERVMDESHRMFAEAFAGMGVTADTLGTCYAMAENVFAVTSSHPGPAPRLLADAAALAEGRIVADGRADGSQTMALVSSGRPLPGVSVRILGAAGETLPDGEIGEIAIRTPWLFEGYVGEDEAQFSDSHFLTGDTGALREGELFVLGRKKDILIVAGRNLYPQDIEALVDETPGVVQGRCVAFAISNPALGTEAVVILAETRETDSARIAGIVQDIRERVTAGMGLAPDNVHLMPHMALIKATSGKISRTLNRDAYLIEIRRREAAHAGSVQPPVPAPASDVRGKVREAITAVLSRKKLGNVTLADDDSMFEIGVIDSLSFIELVLELERVLGRPVPPELVADARAHDSVSTITKCLETHGRGGLTPTGGQPSPEGPLVQMRERRLELAPQFADTDGVLLEPAPYIMLAPTPNYRSATANTDAQGFRVAIKNGAILSAADFGAWPGDKGIVLGNSMSWGTGASDDAHVIHNVLNRQMAETAWYSYALRKSILTQERLAANLFAPLDVDHVVWVTGSVLVMNGLTLVDHKAYLPFPEQLRVHAALGFRQGLLEAIPPDRVDEIGAHIDREMSLMSRIYQGARSRVFVWQPSPMHYDKPMGAEERELLDIARWLPGKPVDPGRIKAQRLLSQRLAKLARTAAAKYGIRFVDPTESPIFQSDEWLFVDLEHLNDAGAAALAAIIRENLAE